MTITGHVDFQSGEQWQSDLAFSDLSNNQATGTTVTFPATGVYVCSNWQSTQLRCSTTLRVFDYTAQWFTDAAGTSQIGERRWAVYDGWPLPTYLTLTNLGPYMKLQTSNFSGGNGSAFFRGVFTNRALGPFQPGYATPIVNAGGVAVGAGATLIRQADYLYAGPAFANVLSTANVWDIIIQSRGSNGVANSIAEFSNAGSVALERLLASVILPPQPIQISLHNADAVGQFLVCNITADVFR